MAPSSLALLLALALLPLAAANNHKLERVPGLDARDAPFKQFAGQLHLSAGERLFYWYTESVEAPETAPLVLWLNGGPGCSSMGGFFTENGPFVVGSDLALRRNPYAWNRKVNLVWLEAPAGVGFSGPTQASEYYNDDTTAAKTREFLQLFLAKYRELQGRPVFITGESYAGVYIPYLVELLLREPVPGLNLAGFAIGNAYTDPPTEGNALFDYYVSHAMVSPSVYAAIQDACGSELGWVYSGQNTSQACADAAAVGFEATGQGHFNIYYIYGDVCLVDNKQVAALHKSIGSAPAGLTPSHRGDIGVCADVFTQAYLNQPSVQVHCVACRLPWLVCPLDSRCGDADEYRKHCTWRASTWTGPTAATRCPRPTRRARRRCPSTRASWTRGSRP
jgi:serine carboxypeptidase-like clade 2